MILKSRIEKLFIIAKEKAFRIPYYYSRVVLNAKSAGKLLQVLSKQQEKSIETLGALAILYRCQRRNLDITAVARELMVHDEQILQTVVNADQMDESDQDFARR